MRSTSQFISIVCIVFNVKHLFSMVVVHCFTIYYILYNDLNESMDTMILFNNNLP